MVVETEVPSRSWSPVDASLEAAMAEAMERTPHRPMSSSTAEPSWRLAKRVWRMPRSAKILVITGIEVTAAAAANTRMTADSLPA